MRYAKLAGSGVVLNIYISSMLSQYERFLSVDNFKLAFIRLRNAKRNFYKTIYYDDLKIFGLFLEENIESVINLIKQDIYVPEKGHKIFIPKKGFFVRPLSMLTFIDLLVYQSITNVIADECYDIISPYYDNTLFGNIINPSFAKPIDRQFFFKSWKKRWQRFNEVSKEHFNHGYRYLSEFDIASFFDTIDHSILCQILSNSFNIEHPLLELLSKCLEAWTADSNHQTFKSKHGIPQGPISSPLLADLYLFQLDTEIKSIKKLDYKYIRYVDDIRIFSKDIITSQKLIATLDLYSRDLGLIPQASKILIKEITDIDKELKVQNSKFSDIVKEFKEENEGKPLRSLKSKTHRQLKKRFLNCFKEKSEEIYLDKTILNFSLFKLNKDEEIKRILIDNYKLLLAQFEAVLYYLKTHFDEDSETLKFINDILDDENILFHHIVALCFKFFPHIPFNEKIYHRYTFEKHRHWLVNFFIIGWLYKNGKKELILTSTNEDNHFINRELNYFKYLSSSDNSYRRILSSKLLESVDPMIALQGLTLLFTNSVLLTGFKHSINQNHFLKYIFTQQPADIINYTIHNEWKILNSEIFFNNLIWNNADVYIELKSSFLLFIKSSDDDPSKALLNLNSFNNLVFNKLCDMLLIKRVSPDYGVNLNSGILDKKLPACNRYWTEINEKRNQKTDAHPYDKFGNIRLRITSKEFKEILKKEKLAISELLDLKVS